MRNSVMRHSEGLNPGRDNRKLRADVKNILEV